MNIDGCERKRLRLAGYDYSKNGYYFITICTQGREDFFGEILNGVMGINEMGCVAAKCWQEIPKHFGYVKLGAWQIMPNHLHGVLLLYDRLRTVGDRHACLPTADKPTADKPTKPQYKRLPVIIGSFKSAVTKKINGTYNVMDRHACPLRFQWQRSYYDHIIRNKKSLKNISEYIRNNPNKWQIDVENKRNGFSESEIKQHYNNLFKI